MSYPGESGDKKCIGLFILVIPMLYYEKLVALDGDKFYLKKVWACENWGWD